MCEEAQSRTNAMSVPAELADRHIVRGIDKIRNKMFPKILLRFATVFLFVLLVACKHHY
jgi:hypothetical protein